MEEDLDTPLHPYDHETRNYVGNEEDHGDPRILNVDVLEKKAEGWGQPSVKHMPRDPLQTYEDDIEIVPVSIVPYWEMI
jgi:hypothetical protein